MTIKSEDKKPTVSSAPPPRLSEFIEELAQACSGDDLTLGEFFLQLSVFGHMIICLLFAIPFLFPAPLPGLSTIFGFVICAASFQIVMGCDPWLPMSWRAKIMPGKVLNKIFTGTSWILKRVEKFTKPRLLIISGHSHVARITGAVIFVVSLLLSLPMPPGFNAPPALAIVVLCLGSIEKDGLLIIAGYILSAINVLLFSGFFLFGFSLFQH